jgi:RNA polymerase sigma-70 factor (ECF subfamily)
MDDETLDRLVTEAQAGNAEAFGAIFDAYVGPIHRFIASRVNRPSDAEDLTQLVFVKALEALPRYEARGIPFGGWLFRLARNAIIDHIRTRKDHLSLLAAATRETDEAGPEARAALRDDLDRVAVALRDLTDDQREVIELRFFAGLSVLEAATAMGRQEGTIRGLQFRAIAALRRSLGIEIAEPALATARSPIQSLSAKGAPIAVGAAVAVQARP